MRILSTGFAWLIGAAVLSIVGPWAAGSYAQSRLQPGPFTSAQASAGRAAYAASCAGCHEANLAGSGDQPPLAGPSFMATWGARSTRDLYDDIRSQMPYGKGDSLDPTTYQNIVAFILLANGAQPGDQSFGPNVAVAVNSVANGQMPANIARPARGANEAADEGGASVPRTMRLGLTLPGHIKNYAPVTNDMLIHPDPNDWLIYRGNYQGWSYSPLVKSMIRT